jgi:lysylphosphatidylglycerol synthetase-like protein (DUF2156 family)
MILAFKLILTPFFICVVTLAGRRWGPTVSGLLIGLPLTSGPISVFLALQYGNAFAARAATGNMVGQVSVCLFCLAYFLSSQKLNWIFSAAAALLSFLVATFVFDRFVWALLPASILLGCVILVFSRLMPKRIDTANVAIPPRWDLPARMVIATTFILVLTEISRIDRQ